MRTINFSEILYRAVTLCGFDRSAIQDSTFRMIRDFASQRIAHIWEQEPWPDIVRVQEMTTTSDSEGVDYINLTSSIGDVLQVYSLNPKVTARAVPVAYYLDDDGTNRRIIVMDGTSTVWVEYRQPKPDLFGEPFDATLTYAPGAQVYFDTGTGTGSYLPSTTSASAGNFYTCLTATTIGQSPTTNAAKWSVVKIPYFCGDYVTKAVFSDYLRTESQFDAAALAEAEADNVKMLQVDRVLRAEGQVRRLNMINTY